MKDLPTNMLHFVLLDWAIRFGLSQEELETSSRVPLFPWLGPLSMCLSYSNNGKNGFSFKRGQVHIGLHFEASSCYVSDRPVLYLLKGEVDSIFLVSLFWRSGLMLSLCWPET